MRRIGVYAAFATVGCCFCLSAQGAFKGRLVEVAPAQMEWGDKVPILLLSITNLDSTLSSHELPYEWYGPIVDVFSVHYKGEVLLNPHALSYYGYDKKTVLAPGERVTCAFRLSFIAKLPPASPTTKEPLKVQLETFGDKNALLGPPAYILFGGGEATSALPLEKIAGGRELSLALALLKFSRISSEDKLRIVRMAVEAAQNDVIQPESFWNLVTASDDAYAVVETLKVIPPFLEKHEGLFELLQSKDLAIRRAAIRTLGRLQPNEQIASRLENFLKTQKDAPILDYGNEAVRKLRGRK